MSTNSYWFKQKTDKLTLSVKKSNLLLFCLNGNNKKQRNYQHFYWGSKTCTKSIYTYAKYLGVLIAIYILGKTHWNYKLQN